jgi:hypothetical protein
MGRLKGWPLLGVTLISCGVDFNAYFNTYYNLKNLAGRIDRLEEIGDTLNVKRLYDSLEIKSAYLIKYYPRSKYVGGRGFLYGIGIFKERSIREGHTKIPFPKGQNLNLEGRTLWIQGLTMRTLSLGTHCLGLCLWVGRVHILLRRRSTL